MTRKNSMPRLMTFLMAALFTAASLADTPDPTLEFVLELKVRTGDGFGIGRTAEGERYVIPITGGVFEGPLIRGEVLAGGADYQTHHADINRTDLCAIYCIRTDDGVNIQVRNEGMIADDKGKTYFYTSPRFEAPVDSRYAWLNNAIYVCRPSGGSEGEIWLKVWKVTDQ